jgi:hypothetical protein
MREVLEGRLRYAPSPIVTGADQHRDEVDDDRDER